MGTGAAWGVPRAPAREIPAGTPSVAIARRRRRWRVVGAGSRALRERPNERRDAKPVGLAVPAIGPRGPGHPQDPQDPPGPGDARSPALREGAPRLSITQHLDEERRAFAYRNAVFPKSP